MVTLRRHRGLVLLAAVVLIGFGLRAWGMTWGLYDANVSRRPHPDEWVVFWVFHWFDHDHSLDPCPNSQQHCFYDWGGLYLYLSFGLKTMLAPLMSALPGGPFGPHADPEFTRAVLAGRIVSIAASTATIVVVYRAGLRMRGVPLGLVAATVTALCGLLSQLAHFATPDSITILCMSLTLLAALHAVDRPTPLRFGVAGGAAGLAVGSEYHMVVLILPILGSWLLTGRRDWRLLGVAGATMAGTWLLVNPYAVVHPGAFLDANLHSLRLRTVDSAAQYQDRWSRYGPAILYVVRFPFGYGVGFAFTAWLVAGAVWGIVRRDRYTVILLLWIIPYFILVTISPAKFMRYSAPLLPPLTLLAARCLLDSAQLPWARARATLLAAALISAVYSFTYDTAYTRLFAATDSRQIAAAWLQQHAAPHAEVGFEEIPNGLLNLPYFAAEDGFRPCFSTFEAVHLEGPMRYFVTDDYALEAHPYVDAPAVDQFRRSLQNSPAYRRVLRIHQVPSLFGLEFPIAGSPHDWRYPDHQITVFRHLSPGVPSLGQCFPSLSAAQRALYLPPPDTLG